MNHWDTRTALLGPAEAVLQQLDQSGDTPVADLLSELGRVVNYQSTDAGGADFGNAVGHGTCAQFGRLRLPRTIRFMPVPAITRPEGTVGLYQIEDYSYWEDDFCLQEFRKPLNHTLPEVHVAEIFQRQHLDSLLVLAARCAFGGEFTVYEVPSTQYAILLDSSGNDLENPMAGVPSHVILLAAVLSDHRGRDLR